MQALRRKMTVAELGQLSPLSIKSPPFFFQPTNGYSSIFAKTNTQTNKYTDIISATVLATFFPRRLMKFPTIWCIVYRFWISRIFRSFSNIKLSDSAKAPWYHVRFRKYIILKHFPILLWKPRRSWASRVFWSFFTPSTPTPNAPYVARKTRLFLRWHNPLHGIAVENSYDFHGI